MKTPLFLNIGLNTNDNKPLDVRDVLRAVNFQILSAHVWPSPAGNESCVALAVLPPEWSDGEAIAGAIHLFCGELKQDCIAIWDGAQGQLIGPNVDAWGEFHPAFFVLPDGRLLADTLPSAPRKHALTACVEISGDDMLIATFEITPDEIPTIKKLSEAIGSAQSSGLYAPDVHVFINEETIPQ